MVVNYYTALLALPRRAGLRSGERVLVHGAGGGLGSAFVQVAVALGARVIAVAGSPEGRALARTAGAQVVHDPLEWFAAIRATGGVDVIVDPVGGDVFDQSVRCPAPEGRLLTVGFASGQIPGVAVNRLLLRNSAVLGVNWAGLVHAEPGLFRATAAQLDGLIAAGMTPLPSTVYDLADAEAAFTAIENRDTAGKTVLLVRRLGAVAA